MTKSKYDNCIACNNYSYLNGAHGPCSDCIDASRFARFTGNQSVPERTNSQQAISDECDSIKNMLIEKNRKYGDSALQPKRVFSRASAVEQIKVRLDDKISRLMSAQSDEDEDVTADLIGYLILLRVAQRGRA